VTGFAVLVDTVVLADAEIPFGADIAVVIEIQACIDLHIDVGILASSGILAGVLTGTDVLVDIDIQAKIHTEDAILLCHFVHHGSVGIFISCIVVQWCFPTGVHVCTCCNLTRGLRSSSRRNNKRMRLFGLKT